MTLSELLGELKQADPKTYEDISHLDLAGWRQPRNQALDHLQGCLQRQCIIREWDLQQDQWIIKQNGPGKVFHYATITKGIAETGEPCEYEGRGQSQAEALLAAYVAAIKEEKR
jgi:hypothetical protein